MKTCTVEGCDRKYLAKGMCGLHWDRASKGRDLHAEYGRHHKTPNEGDRAPHPDSRLTFRGTIVRSEAHRWGQFDCDCGGTTQVRLDRWRSGETKSCGCLVIEVWRTHGASSEPWFHNWLSMLARSTPGTATQQQNPTYIGVGHDPRWENPYEFGKDMGDSYFPHACLARYGDKGDYTKDNCRWLTRAENTREGMERKMIRLTDGRFGIDVARENGISRQVFNSRIRTGWSPEDASTVKPGAAGRRVH